jgi:hypothetical protein
MNRKDFVTLLNSKNLDIQVFREAAKLLDKSLSSEVEEFIRISIQNPLFSNYILERYNYCTKLLINHFQINSVKDLQSNNVLKYY